MWDDDWYNPSATCVSCSAGSTCYTYANYSGTKYNFSAAYLVVRTPGSWPEIQVNYTIPAACYLVNLTINLTKKTTAPVYSNYSCWTGTAWALIKSFESGYAVCHHGLYWVNESYPYNITVDIGNDGTKEYFNNTIWNTTATITFNSTSIAVINTYLNTTCTADWGTGICYVPMNITGAYKRA